MKASELRIGNFVGIKETALHSNGCNHLEAVFEVEILNKSVVGFKGFHSGEWYTDLKPIPITEEWLISFGFVYQDALIEGKSGWFKYLNEGFSLYLNNYFQVSIIYSLNFLDININYVHQLQNLYFALTGKELNYEKATQN